METFLDLVSDLPD